MIELFTIKAVINLCFYTPNPLGRAEDDETDPSLLFDYKAAFWQMVPKKWRRKQFTYDIEVDESCYELKVGKEMSFPSVSRLREYVNKFVSSLAATLELRSHIYRVSQKKVPTIENTPFQQNGACWVIRIDIARVLYCFYCTHLFFRPWKLFLERFSTSLLN